jgi:endonuclease YncB( thermonuclease family)
MIEALICATVILSDGDSGHCIQPSGERVRFRLDGIDAPELSDTRCRTQPTIWACLPANRAHAVQARDRARQLVANGARCHATDTDRYQRIVVRCSVQGRDLGTILIREGLAISDPRYGNPQYREAEARARRERRGVWG